MASFANSPRAEEGRYYPETHSVHSEGRLAKDVLRHEVRHGLQMLLEPFFIRRMWKHADTSGFFKRIKAKLRNSQYASQFGEPSNPLSSRQRGDYGESLVNTLIVKHGEDALLLLWVCPPRNKTGAPDVWMLPSWYDQILSQGILKQTGGFTRKGLQFFRERVQSQLIFERLQEAEQTRKSNKK